MKDIFKYIGGDKSLWILVILLSLISIPIIYSSTASLAYKVSDGRTTQYLISQLLYIVGGWLIIFVVHLINYEFYFKNRGRIFWFAVFLMVYTAFFGVEINGVKRWLKIPIINMTFQPSDLLKIALTIMIAAQLAARQKVIDKVKMLPNFFSWNKHPQRNMEILKKITVPILGTIALSAALVIRTNLSTVAIMCFTCLIILILGRVRCIEIGRTILAAVIGLVLMIGVLKITGENRVDTWISRTNTFFDNNSSDAPSETEFQVEQARIAVASGGIGGKGPGMSTQRSNLPHPYSDYAYAFIIEEYGSLIAILILICYLWIFYRGIVIFRKCKSSFASILVLGLSLMITLQAMIHIGVSVDAAPVTGQTLPLISKGGSSLLFTCIMFGIILGISRRINDVEYQVKLDEKRKLVVDEWEQVVLKEQDLETDQIKKLFEDDEEQYHGVIWHDYKD